MINKTSKTDIVRLQNPTALKLVVTAGANGDETTKPNFLVPILSARQLWICLDIEYHCGGLEGVTCFRLSLKTPQRFSKAVDSVERLNRHYQQLG